MEFKRAVTSEHYLSQSCDCVACQVHSLLVFVTYLLWFCQAHACTSPWRRLVRCRRECSVTVSLAWCRRRHSFIRACCRWYMSGCLPVSLLEFTIDRPMFTRHFTDVVCSYVSSSLCLSFCVS